MRKDLLIIHVNVLSSLKDEAKVTFQNCYVSVYVKVGGVLRVFWELVTTIHCYGVGTHTQHNFLHYKRHHF